MPSSEAAAPLVAGLAEIGALGEARFGGKAHGLAQLLAAGARVPAGFASSASVLGTRDWPSGSRAELLRRGAALLALGPVAVRSSAIGEDSEARSFAGMLETILGVADEAALLVAVDRCVASGGSERVLAYAGQAEPMAVGVVVQSELAPRAAGVCFTVDPAGRGAGVVIEAVAGLGDALVSGRAQPEAWRVYRTGFGLDEARRDPGAASRVLTEAEVLAITREARGLAERLGYALDLEWAIDSQGLWWLQARPVTARVAVAALEIERFEAGVDDGPVTLWANWNLREVIPRPFPPLAWDLWRDAVLPVVIEPLFGIPRRSPLFAQVVPVDLIQGRIYWNMNALLVSAFSRTFVRRSLGAIDAEAAEVAKSLFERGPLRSRRLHGNAGRLLLGSARALARMAFGMLGAFRPRRAMRALRECAAELRLRPDLAGLSTAALLTEIRLLAEPPARRLRDTAHVLGVGMLVFSAAERAFRDEPEARQLLTVGIPGNPTTEISIGVDTLVAAARALQPVFDSVTGSVALLDALATSPPGREWILSLRAFLDRFGQRCPGEFDLLQPRWSEDPTMILELVRAGLHGPQGEGVAARLQRLAGVRRHAVATACARAPAWRRPLMRGLAWLVAEYMPLREAPKHYTMVCYARMRAATLEAGQRLAVAGVLASAGEVFFLTFDELGHELASPGARGPLGQAVQKRRTRYAGHLAAPAPHYVRSDGVPVDVAAPSEDGVLRGVGASAGRVRGPVRVLREPDPAAMAEGDVIVVEFADPGWTPLFPRAAAVVMEVGGAMCHAAVVARELGIPAVFGVRGATRLLQDDQLVTVDGSLGTVTR